MKNLFIFMYYLFRSVSLQEKFLMVILQSWYDGVCVCVVCVHVCVCYVGGMFEWC